MRLYGYAALMSMLMLAACNTTTSSTPKVVVGGKQLKVDIAYSVNPDCSSRGTSTVRLIEAPRHGKVDMREGTDFPYFSQGNIHAHCNASRVPATQILYTSSGGYTGPDSFTAEFIYPSGRARTHTYKVDVR
jgi:hypothetical protein